MAEMRVAVALTLRRFRLTLGAPEVRRLYTLIMKAEGGLRLQLEPLEPPQSPSSPSSPSPPQTP